MMLCIQDATQNSEVTQQAQGDSVYIGYSDSAQEGTWEWVDGCDSSYTNWLSGEPNDGGGEDVAGLTSSGAWNDMKTSSSTYVCACQSGESETILPGLT